jgi:aspartyl-tRNA(Asn)/glutamyl-tRNA(Gln) amidotransferase subunit A
MTPLHDLSLVEARDLLSSGQISAEELTVALLERARLVEPKVHAFVAISEEEALAAARAADAASARGEPLGPLHGIPVGIKDLIDVRGLPTEAGSRVRAGMVAAADATVVERLRRAGAIVIGKTVTHEFAFGSASPPTRCVWDPARIPGGSSGGSAVAVGAGEALAAIGTDTGSSIRNPASLNGVTGLKPTYGRVSRHGVIPCSWSCDHVGPIARTALDCAVVLSAIAGPDPADPTTIGLPPLVLDELSGVAGLRIGVPENFFFDRISPDVERTVRLALDDLEALGAELTPVSVEDVELAYGAIVILCLVEGAAYHADQMAERAHLYGDEVRTFLRAGSLVPGTSYLDAQRIRVLVSRGLRAAFEGEQLDALVSPTSPLGPVLAGDELVSLAGGEPEPIISHYARLTCPFNLAGLPALTVPCGFDDQELPVGLQIAGRPFAEDTVLALGAAYQQATRWHLRRPELVRGAEQEALA